MNKTVEQASRWMPVTPRSMGIGTKRLFDIAVSGLLLLLFSLVISAIWLAVKLTSPGPVLYWSNRVGRDNCIFRMAKFRSMRTGTPEVATHLLRDADTYLTPIGSILRRSSLDELPQLLMVLRGDLSLVGPRPALFNQDDLISLRTKCGVHSLTPGITGWAQVHGRDDLPISVKVDFDFDYLQRRSLWLDLKILLMTVLTVVRREGVSH